MNDLSKVSVIIPAFNASEYILNAISSVFKQNYENTEIILIDDGSVDNTKDVIENYIQDGRIKYFYQQNSGPSAARNKGLKESTGDFICFLDADDELLEGSFHKRMNLLEEKSHLRLVFTDFYKVYSESDCRIHLKNNDFLGKFSRAVDWSSNGRYIFGDKFFECALEYNPFILTTTVMMRSDVVSNIGFFNAELRVAEDVDYWLRIVREYQVGFIDEPLSKYNNFRSTLTKNDELFFRDSISYYSTLYREIKGIKKYENCEKLLRRKLSVLEFNFGYHLFNSKEFGESKNHFRKSFCWRPANSAAIKWNILSLFSLPLIYNLKNNKSR